MYNPRILTCTSQHDLLAEIESIETYPEGIERMLLKGSARVMRISQVEASVAMILKQELLALDGDALIRPDVYLGQRETTTDALIFASLRQLRELIARFRRMPLPAIQTLATELAQTLAAYEAVDRGTLVLGRDQLHWGQRSYVAALLDVAYDPADDEQLDATAELIRRVLQQADIALEAGADLLVLDSTIIAANKQSVLVAIVKALTQQRPRPLVVRGSAAELMASALQAGAHMVYDPAGLRTATGRWNQPLAALVARHGVPIVLAQAALMATDQPLPDTSASAIMAAIISDLRTRIDYAQSQGIKQTNLVLDPGLGTTRSPTQNRALLRRLAELRSIGVPMLVTPDFMDAMTDEQRAMVTTLAIERGVDILCSPGVATCVRAARAADAVLRNEQLPLADH